MTTSPFEPRLSAIIEGVEVNLTHLGLSVRVVIAAEALQASFNAGDAPENWLEAAVANRKAIEHAAKIALVKSGKPIVFLQRF